jgi:phosphoribosylanthranilate isomerase
VLPWAFAFRTIHKQPPQSKKFSMKESASDFAPQEFFIKICGMRSEPNIRALSVGEGSDESVPNYMGFIFYAASPRYVGDTFTLQTIRSVPETVRTVCVVVDATADRITTLAQHYGFHAVQLHGNESPEFCRQLRTVLPRGVEVWKALSIATADDMARAADYAHAADRLLFDTKGASHGGNGTRFDWSLLEQYNSETPFFLSGGISADDVDEIVLLARRHKRLCGVDVNSRFETSPGVKDVAAVQEFVRTLRRSRNNG